MYVLNYTVIYCCCCCEVWGFVLLVQLIAFHVVWILHRQWGRWMECYGGGLGDDHRAMEEWGQWMDEKGRWSGRGCVIGLTGLIALECRWLLPNVAPSMCNVCALFRALLIIRRCSNCCSNNSRTNTRSCCRIRTVAPLGSLCSACHKSPANKHTWSSHHQPSINQPKSMSIPHAFLPPNVFSPPTRATATGSRQAERTAPDAQFSHNGRTAVALPIPGAMPSIGAFWCQNVDCLKSGVNAMPKFMSNPLPPHSLTA